MVTPDVVPFLPQDTFLEENHDAIEALFADLVHDFPERTVVSEDAVLDTSSALTFSSEDSLSLAAIEWLHAHTVGKQHGYDRANDKEQKIYIPHGDKKYMDHLRKLHAGAYNFVEGSPPNVTTSDRNILVGGGFPHLNAGRLRTALSGEYDSLADVHSVTVLAGQRPRWNDNPNEATSEIVIQRTAQFTDFDIEKPGDNKKLEVWAKVSKLARDEAAKSEGEKWIQSYATEAEMGRLALEFAMLRASEDVFDWDAYPVIEHVDEAAAPIIIGDYVAPARTIRSWEYITNDGKSHFVVNGAAVARDKGGEPRPTSASVMHEAYTTLSEHLRDYESIIAFGAPHIRAGYHTAAQILESWDGNVKPLHLSVSPWEFHEPPVTGIASIVGMDVVDKQLRRASVGQ